MNFVVDKENNKVKVAREFAAPISKVWAAWTQSQILDQWWAPKPWHAKTKIMDFREGGHWLYAMVSPEGQMHWSRVDYKSINQSKSYSAIGGFCDENGDLNDQFSVSSWLVKFTESSDLTTVNIDITYKDLSSLEKMMEMGFQGGLTMVMENLDNLLK